MKIDDSTAPSECPKCGGEIQATKEWEEYFSMVGGAFIEPFVAPDMEAIGLRFYCENECPDPFTLEQIAALEELMPGEKPAIVMRPRLENIPDLVAALQVAMAYIAATLDNEPRSPEAADDLKACQDALSKAGVEP